MSDETQLPAAVGIVGGGRMGAGIAFAFLGAGSRVHVVESSGTAAHAAAGRVEASARKASERSALPLDPDALLRRLSHGTDIGALSECDLVVEAVPEDVGLKRQVLAAIEGAAPQAVLATNTSSLSVDGLASALRSPESFIGLHFFNPVPTTVLVEVVCGSTTGDGVIAAALRWVESLGRTPITVRDAPGFASSRLGVALGLEAMRMLEEGVASAEDIDTAMTLGYKHATGPLRTTDIVGLDVRLAVAEHLESELGPRFAPPAVLRDKVAAGDLGRKVGRGFFTW